MLHPLNSDPALQACLEATFKRSKETLGWAEYSRDLFKLYCSQYKADRGVWLVQWHEMHRSFGFFVTSCG